MSKKQNDDFQETVAENMASGFELFRLEFRNKQIDEGLLKLAYFRGIEDGIKLLSGEREQ